jgi:hypothetical protein
LLLFFVSSFLVLATFSLSQTSVVVFPTAALGAALQPTPVPPLQFE